MRGKGEKEDLFFALFENFHNGKTKFIRKLYIFARGNSILQLFAGVFIVEGAAGKNESRQVWSELGY